MGFGEAIQIEFPWATFSIDSDHYFWHEDSEQADRLRDVEDSEESEVGDENVASRSEIRPYEDDGEVASWRLELSLNELGRAFLLTDKFLASDE